MTQKQFKTAVKRIKQFPGGDSPRANNWIETAQNAQNLKIDSVTDHLLRAAWYAGVEAEQELAKEEKTLNLTTAGS